MQILQTIILEKLSINILKYHYDLTKNWPFIISMYHSIWLNFTYGIHSKEWLELSLLVRNAAFPTLKHLFFAFNSSSLAAIQALSEILFNIFDNMITISLSQKACFFQYPQ